ncbi:MAG TPA: hypothetical protein PKA20_06145 [Burkholderiaceae bacterium]|nr:hypothetical protein [Burkholderiaceae bacterium]
MKPLPARPAADWLARQPGFQDLAAHSSRLARLQADLDRCAPMKGLVVNSLTDSVLVVTTRTAGLAAKLRQCEPSLLAGLTRSGWKVSRIRIRPQPQRAADRPPAPAVRQKSPVPAAALAQLNELIGRTEDGPLKEALAAMVRRHRKR